MPRDGEWTARRGSANPQSGRMQTVPGSVTRGGLVWGGVGVLAFSFTVIFTRLAVAQLDPLFVGAGRAVVAAAIAGVASRSPGRGGPHGVRRRDSRSSAGEWCWASRC